MKRAFGMIMTVLLGMSATPLSAQLFTTLYGFTNQFDGINPECQLVLSGNILYGTAVDGGGNGNGAIFSVRTNGTAYTNIYSFMGSNDGAVPVAGLILSNNTLYGTAAEGGTLSAGTVFEVRTNGILFTNLHNFTGGSDGEFPETEVVLSGNTLYGVAADGGDSYGTVYSVTTNGTGFQILHTFTNGNDGSYPSGQLILSGNTLFGTAYSGGSNGFGTVFSLNTNGSSFTILHTFTATHTNAIDAYTNRDGANPNAGLILSGNTLYGTAEIGGSNSYGTVFSVNTNSSNFTTLYSFIGASNGVGDGGSPQAELILSSNTLYGTASGVFSGASGTVFSINTNGSNFTILHSFMATSGTGGEFGTNSDGSQPYGGLILSSNILYGTTSEGGPVGNGTVFSVDIGVSVPVLTWTNPAPLVYGTALSTNQLNAMAYFNLPGTYIYSPTNGTVLNAGTNILSVLFLPNNTTFYTNASTNVSVVVTPAQLQVTADNQSKTYGVPYTFNDVEFTSMGLVNGNTVNSVTLVSAGAPAAATVAGSPYPIIPSLAAGTGLSNYTISYINGELTVNPAALMIQANSAVKTYGQMLTFAGTEFTPTGLANNDMVSSVTLNSAGAAAAATVTAPGPIYSITPSQAVGTGLGNYDITYETGALVVIAAPLTITANSANKTYGQTLTFAGTEFTPSGLGNNDMVSSVTLNCAGTVATAAATPPGLSYPITPSQAVGTGLGNYNITYNPGTLTVSTAALTVTANSTNKIYGQTLTFAGTEFTPSGLLNNDAVTSVILNSPGAAATASVAGSPYPITPSLAVGTGLNNYVIGYSNGMLTVNQATPMLTWSNPTPIVYGAALTTNQLDASANVNGGFAYTPAEGSVLDAGTNGLSVLFTPMDTVDYSDANDAASLVVTPAPLTVAAADASEAYGQAIPALTGSITGLTNGDDITANYSCIATNGSPVGAYPITPMLSDPDARLSNYMVTLVGGTLTITQAVPVVTWPTPAPIPYGTALTSNQLDASANVLGGFSYTPTFGAVLNQGVTVLSVVFTPSDSMDYSSVNYSVNLEVSPPQSSTAILTILHSFTNVPDGDFPVAGLTASGNTLFGTTHNGGASGDGTVFSVNTDGSGYRVLHSFAGADGESINAGLSLAGNMLYGSAFQGGANSEGTLFSLGTDGSSFTNIYSFTGASDGDSPTASPILSGNVLYGTTEHGGAFGDGTVFTVQTNGADFTTLYNFDGTNGEEPQGELVLGGDVLYGTTYLGGTANSGTIFTAQTNGSNLVLLDSFAGGDGTNITAGLVLSGGTLYGTSPDGGEYGNGLVFSIDANGSNFAVLHSFNPATNDGAEPLTALCLSGNVLYGTTEIGGAFGDGTIFSINTDGSDYTQLYSFGQGGISDGIQPNAPVILVGNSLYGTASASGSGGGGTVFGLQIAGVVFTLEPVGATNVPVGSNVVFTAAGESLSMPTATIQYQWRLNGVNIPGATTMELSFQDVQPTNGGTVTVTISDGINAATSVPVDFSVAISIQATGNTNFANRFPLGQASSLVVGSSNTNGAPEPGEPQIITGNPGGKPIWFEWQPDTSGTAVFTTRGSDFDTTLGAYTGTNIGGLTRVPSCVNDDDSGGDLTSQVSFNCLAGTAYEIVVDGYWGVSGNVVLSWVTENFAQPLPSLLQVPPRQTVSSNGAAVTLVCEPDSGVPSWFLDGQPTGVTGPDFPIIALGDTNVGTYIAETTLGGAVASTEPAHVQFNVLEDGTSDTNSIAWNKFLDSANSPYSNPPLSSIRKLGGGGDTRGYSVSQTFGTVGAQAEPNDPPIDGQIGGSPYWYTYITPTNGEMRINTVGSLFNTMLAVFIGAGKSFASLTNVGAAYTTNHVLNGQPQVYIPNVVKGRTYSIEVDGYKGVSGVVELNIYLGAPVVIGAPPQNQSVTAGGNATFTVGADGSTPLSYFWQFNGVDIPGATNATVTVLNAQATNAGVYTVVVSNLVSVASNSATLSILNTLTLDIPSLSGGGVQVQLMGAAGGNYIIQASTDLLTWIPLITNNAINGSFLLTDTNASNFNGRFYRGVVVSQ